MHLVISIFIGVFAALWLLNWCERRRTDRAAKRHTALPAKEHFQVAGTEQSIDPAVWHFYEAGKATYPNWRDLCNVLIQRGADPAFALLLIEMPDGVHVAAALSHDTAELARITGLQTTYDRAIALKEYSAKVADRRPPTVLHPSSPVPLFDFPPDRSGIYTTLVIISVLAACASIIAVLVAT